MTIPMLDDSGSLASILGLLIGLPTAVATLYTTLKAREEFRQVQEGTFHSRDCLEFVAGDGTCINVVPLETLHSLPKEGDVIFLPGEGFAGSGEYLPGAYLVGSIEHIYAPATHKKRRRQEARLTKAVAHVTSLNARYENIETVKPEDETLAAS